MMPKCKIRVCAELHTSAEKKRNKDSSESRKHQVRMEGTSALRDTCTFNGVLGLCGSTFPSQSVAIAALRGNAYL